jgi:ribonuclease D
MARRRTASDDLLPQDLITTSAAYAEFLDHLSRFKILGLDTEFVGEESYRPELCLVQVSTPERLVLLDPYALGDLAEFWKITLEPDRVVVVHAGREEVRMCRFAIGKPPANVFDLQIAAGLVGYVYPIGYASLVQETLKIRMNKGETLTDWRQRPLSVNQVRYAYDDVRYLLPIWKLLSNKLKNLQRESWAVEEFRAFVTRAILDDPSVERWRKIKGIGSLDRRELAVARELYVWRDQFAARLNRPTRVLLRDDILVEIARQGTQKSFDITTLRGLPRGENDAILNAVQRAVALPLSQCPELGTNDRDASNVNTLASFLAVALAEYCRGTRLASSITATMHDLKQLVRFRQGDDDAMQTSSLDRGWRAKNIRPYLESILDGKTVLRVSDPLAEHPISIEPFGGL